MIPMSKIPLFFTFFVSIYAGFGDFVHGQNHILVPLGNSLNMTCHVEGRNLQNFNWSKTIGADNSERLNNFSKNNERNSTYAAITIQFVNVTRDDNGTYECWAQTENGHTIKNTSDLLVLEKPEVQEFVAKAVMVGKLYLSWKVYDGNDPVAKYSFFYRVNDSHAQWLLLDELDKGEYSNYVVDSQKKLENGSTYQIGIEAVNTISRSESYISTLVTPLEKDFVPKPVLNKATNYSITITWPAPEGDLQDYYNYTVAFKEKGKDENNTHIETGNNTLTIESLQPKTIYLFKVKTCIINHPDVCAKWSEEMEGYTSNNSSSSTFASLRILLINILSLTALIRCIA